MDQEIIAFLEKEKKENGGKIPFLHSHSNSNESNEYDFILAEKNKLIPLIFKVVIRKLADQQELFLAKGLQWSSTKQDHAKSRRGNKEFNRRGLPQDT